MKSLTWDYIQFLRKLPKATKTQKNLLEGQISNMQSEGIMMLLNLELFKSKSLFFNPSSISIPNLISNNTEINKFQAKEIIKSLFIIFSNILNLKINLIVAFQPVIFY